MGADQAAWAEYDACALIEGGARLPGLLVDHPGAPKRLGELLPDAFGPDDLDRAAP